VHEDHIVRAGSHLLRLTTAVPGGSVSEQSLTVRDTDFHPVIRTVAFRDRGTVEIAEVDFKILPWSAVDSNIFEPVEGTLRALATRPSRVLPFPRMTSLLSDGQLDETELNVRLLLNQLHADAGEQIEITRTPQGIALKALVETDERKRTLQAKLSTVSHLKVCIQSVSDLKDSPEAQRVTSVTTALMPDQPSPLKTYLQARGRSVRDINALAQQLFNSALTISQESRAIDDLWRRFVPSEQKTIIASATLSELIYSHVERLRVALKQENELLADAQVASVPGNEVPVVETSSFLQAASTNLALCKELTQTNRTVTRSADRIFAEVRLSIEDLTANLHKVYEKPQDDSL